ncbi:S8 family serine peptidase [bacterium]|nr:S8 family serine peptidase [bacterium]
MRNRLNGACLLALVALFAVSTVVAAPVLPMDEPLHEAIKNADSAELLPVVALMRDQYSLEMVAQSVEGLTRAERKRVVWSVLSDHADATHADLLAMLDGQAAKGLAADVRSLVLANAVSFQATPELIEQIAGRIDVRQLIYDPMTRVIPETPTDGVMGVDELDEIAWGVAQINAPAVWEEGYTGEGVIVAVIDTGVNYNHTDLADHLWDGGETYPNHGFDYANNDDNPMDDNGHGTHCSGSAVGDGTSGTQTGVAPDASLMCIKVLDGGGFGDYADTWSALDFALANQADVISMSLGWTNLSAAPRATFRQSFDGLNLAGLVSSVAAGNERVWGGAAPENLRTPGNVPSPWRHPGEVEAGTRSGVITVGATQSNDVIANFSSYGPASWQSISPFNDYPYGGGSVGLLKPDVSAPGVSVTSLTYNNNTGYVGGTTWSGTSMATPHVAGVLALMLNKWDELTPEEADSILQTTSLDLGPVGKDNDYGAGRVQADEAVDAVVGITGTINGVVSNSVSGDPIEGVTVSFLETGRVGITNSEGEYSVDVQIGTYTLVVNHLPMQPFQQADIVVTEEDTTTVDIALSVGSLEITPEALSFTEDAQTHGLTLENAGTADLQVRLNLSPSQEAVEWLDSLFQTDATGITGDSRLRGIKYVDGKFYVTGSNTYANPNYIYVLDEMGTQIDSYIQVGSDLPDASSNGMYDLAFDGTNLIGSDGRDIISFDLETGEEVSRFEGPYNPNRALAYDTDLDYLWVGESLQDIVAVDPETGEEMMTIESDLRTQSLEYVPNDPDGMNLYIACGDNDSERAFYKANTESGDILKVDDLPDAEERDLFGLTYASGYQVYYVALVGLLNGTPEDQMKGWQIDATVGWANLSQIELVLEPEASMTVDVTSMIEGLDPDLYSAYILAEHNGMGETVPVPIELDITNTVGDESETGLPGSYALAQPYPNPFNAMTTVRFTTPVTGSVNVAVFDLLGRQVATLHRGTLEAGRHMLSLSLEDQASGIYFVRMQAGDGFEAVRKVVLIK